MPSYRGEEHKEWDPANTRDLDSGWAWVIVVVSFFVHAMTLGFTYGMGVFYMEFLNAFQESKAKTAWITSLNSCLVCGGGPLASLVVERFGCRVSIAFGGFLSSVGFLMAAFTNDANGMIVTMGLIGGLGFGFCHVPNIVVISQFFSKYRTLALGLSNAGVGVGIVIYPWICRGLIDSFGWRGAVLICAGINAHIIALALLVPRISPIERATKEHAERNKHEKEITEISTTKQKVKNVLQYFKVFRNINFTLLCINTFLVQSGMYIVFTHMVAYALSLNINKTRADLLVSLIGICNMLGRAGLGFIGQQECVDVPQLYVASYFVAGLSIFGCGVWSFFYNIALFGCVFGFLVAAAGPLCAEFTYICVGGNDFNRGLGFLTFFMAIGNLLGAPAAGLVYDMTKFYPASFYLGGACLILCSLLLVPVLINLRKFKRSRIAKAMEPTNEEIVPAIS